MKILFCNYEYPPLGGGGGVVNALLAQEMAKQHEVAVLTSQGLDLPRENMERGVRVIRAPVFFRKKQTVANFVSMFAYMVTGTKVGKRLLQKESFDVINTHFVLPTGPVGDALARGSGIPHVLSIHGGDLYDPSKFTSPHRHLFLRMWVRRLLRRANHVVGRSNNTLQNLRRYYSRQIATRVPLGIQRPKLEKVSRSQFGFADDEVILVTVGRLVARKAVDQLISLIERFQGLAIRLLVLGSGPEEHKLRELAKAKHVEKQIEFMGQVGESEKFRLLQISDLYVSTSQHEGFGLVFLEAMACGLPIVCYDFGGQTDFLQDWESGHLVPLNDLETFREGCLQLIRDPGRRERVGTHNLLVMENYYIDQCARRYEQIFNQVRGKGSPRVESKPVHPASPEMVLMGKS